VFALGQRGDFANRAASQKVDDWAKLRLAIRLLLEATFGPTPKSKLPSSRLMKRALDQVADRILTYLLCELLCYFEHLDEFAALLCVIHYPLPGNYDA
jgi:hypothetical protein